MKPPVRENAATAGKNANLTGPWYTVVMSSLGWRWALYADLKALRRLWAGERADEDNARQSGATTVAFEEE